ncbi:N-acyl-D-amino-acid deacylase family protein [Rhabdothermincola salaria]|uniref:N-acyl-D-amino-acid deacylase family protein n=1 Tax=Rhabdothermincola salaria TaxID=2903142 RepID=UPI001E4CA9A7|nr:amidohydrolase family protein [Rhabdothermincola salaria]MCD9622953.1 amidohydrolase family protein [Rhabdothermincola salaria]
MYDLLLTGGLVVDGTGVPGRLADVAVEGDRIVAVGRLRGQAARRTIDCEGLVVAPGVVDAHTHYDPQITWDPVCDTAALHGVTTVAAGNCGFSVAPCRSDDHDYLAQVFARVEGMDLDSLGHVGWEFETFEEFLATRPGKLGVNLGMYVGHSAVRRWVMGDAAYEREATPDEISTMAAMIDAAMHAGALGLSSSHAPTHLDMADRPVPSRLSSRDEMRALADAQGRHGRGSIAYAPESAVEGIDSADRDFLIELAQRGGVPVITQGLGGRSKVDAPTKTWQESRAFLDRSAALGAPVYSLLMTRPLNGPFDLIDGTTRYEGVPLWNELMALDVATKRTWLEDPTRRDALRRAIDEPNRDPARGSTLPPPFWESLRVSDVRSAENEPHLGRSMSALAADSGKHPADVFFDIALADDLATVFHWSNETPAWRELLKDVQKHPQMIVGVSDGGAHLDRDDGQEWSTHFLSTWWKQERVWRLEEAIRRITAVPAAILGLNDRGVAAAGWAADLFVFDPETVDVGTCREEADRVTGAARFRAVPQGIKATITNGTITVEDGEITGAAPGEVVRPR